MGWLSGWQYRKSHIINPSDEELEDYQMRIIVHYGSGTDNGEHVYLNGKCREDFGDVRFTKDDGVTLLSYWIEEKVDGDYAIFWVKIPYIPASPNTTLIYIYYGKPDATSISDGKSTFLLFDDFNDGDISDWIKTQVGGNSSYGDFQPTSEKKYEGAYGVVFDAKSGGGSTQVLHKSIPTGNYAVTCWIRNEFQSAYNHQIGVSVDFIDAETCLMAVIHWGTFKLRKRVGGRNYDIVVGTEKSYNTWLKLEVFRLSSGLFKAILEGETLNTSITEITNGDVGLFGFGGIDQSGNGYWDLFYVRKYVEPEPSHGEWGSEETAYILKISGYCYDYNGNPVPNATVWLFRTSDKAFIAETTTDENGYYEFIVNEDTDYFLRAHKDGTPNVFGTTDRNIRPEQIQV